MKIGYTFVPAAGFLGDMKRQMPDHLAAALTAHLGGGIRIELDVNDATGQVLGARLMTHFTQVAPAPPASPEKDRIEPDVHSVYTSAAISLKRIADCMEMLTERDSYGDRGPAAISGAILRGLRGQS